MRALHRLGDYLRTSARVEVRGTSPARFLNLCTAGKIEIWDVEYVDPNCLRVSLHARDLRGAVPLLRRSACRVHIVRRKGLHYDAKRAKRRGVLLAALALLGAACLVLNTRVLSFTYTGNRDVTPRRLSQAMEKNGLYVGVRKSAVDASDLRNAMLSEIPELIWFTVTFHGSRAYVDVRERDEMPEIARWDGCADLVSDFHGVVRDVSVYRGEAAVEPGDVVAPGTLLVSGTSPLRLDEKRLELFAQADVLADVWYKTTLAMPLDCLGKRPTGGKKTRWSLVLGKNRLDLYKKGGKEFDNYDKIIKKYTLSLWEGFSLPAALVKETITEYETYLVRLPAGAQAAALTAAAREKTLRLDVGVEPGEAAARNTDSVLYAYAYGTCTRYIGVPVPRK